MLVLAFILMCIDLWLTSLAMIIYMGCASYELYCEFIFFMLWYVQKVQDTSAI